MSKNIYIGIDTGVNTGIAIWSKSDNKFIGIGTLSIHRAMFEVMNYNSNPKYNIVKVRVEDARLRGAMPVNAKTINKYMLQNKCDLITAKQKLTYINNAKLQGVGSVKRDSSIWEDFLKDMKIPYEMVNPMSNITKLDNRQFGMITGLSLNKIDSHSKDACMLVFGI